MCKYFSLENTLILSYVLATYDLESQMMSAWLFKKSISKLHMLAKVPYCLKSLQSLMNCGQKYVSKVAGVFHWLISSRKYFMMSWLKNQKNLKVPILKPLLPIIVLQCGKCNHNCSRYFSYIIRYFQIPILILMK